MKCAFQVMALLSGFAGVYTEVPSMCVINQEYVSASLLFLFRLHHKRCVLSISESHYYFMMSNNVSLSIKLQAIIKKRPSRNINVQNFWLYVFGMIFNLVAICIQDYDEVMNK